MRIDQDVTLEDLIAATAATKSNLRLKYLPVVIRKEETAFSIARGPKASAVMLGDGA